MKNDDAYDNRGHIPGAADYPARWARDALAFREACMDSGCARLDRVYGPHERHRFDLFLPEGPVHGLTVFVHGGYWRLFDKSSWSHFARGCRARGRAVALPSYPLAPEVAIAEITRDIATAIQAAAAEVDGDITLCGHSAGGHLVARMACDDLLLGAEISGRLRAIVPISPLADLRPFIETTMNRDFRLDDETARAESPALMEKALEIPVRVLVGADERPAFLDQAGRLTRAWSGTKLRVLAGRHHFSVIDDLLDPTSETVGWLSA